MTEVSDPAGDGEGDVRQLRPGLRLMGIAKDRLVPSP